MTLGWYFGLFWWGRPSGRQLVRRCCGFITCPALLLDRGERENARLDAAAVAHSWSQ